MPARGWVWAGAVRLVPRTGLRRRAVACCSCRGLHAGACRCVVVERALFVPSVPPLLLLPGAARVSLPTTTAAATATAGTCIGPRDARPASHLLLLLSCLALLLLLVLLLVPACFPQVVVQDVRVPRREVLPYPGLRL